MKNSERRAYVEDHNRSYEVLNDSELGVICERAIEIVQEQYEQSLITGVAQVSGLPEWRTAMKSIRNRVIKSMNRRSKYDTLGNLRA